MRPRINRINKRKNKGVCGEVVGGGPRRREKRSTLVGRRQEERV